MSTPADLQTLLRFLTQDAKVPLATALASVQALQKANLTSIENISKANPEEIQQIFQQQDVKISKQVLNAAKKHTKKRGASNDNVDNDGDGNNNMSTSPSFSPKKRRKDSSIFSLQPASAQSPAELEASLQLPPSSAAPEDVSQVVLFTNRAPLVLAFVVVLLKHTMPEQPLSARLSLAQAYVSMTSRARAVDLGIESGGRAAEAEREELGLGRASVVILGKEVRVLMRWGYDWVEESGELEESTHDDHDGAAAQKNSRQHDCEPPKEEEEEQQQQSPALWGLDLEALSKSSSSKADPLQPGTKAHQSASTTNLPIHTPQSARAYLLKSFDSPPSAQPSKKKVTASAKATEKEQNLGMLLRAIDLLYQSWIGTLGPKELDRRVWGWYVKVRPAVGQGAAGWGGKNEVRLADILALRREA